MISLPILILAVVAPLLQEGTQERVRDAANTYISPRTSNEERQRIVERLSSMGLACVAFVQAVGDGTGPGPAYLPIRYLANELKVDLLRRLGDERGSQSILKLRSLGCTIEARNLSLETILDHLRRQGLGIALVNPAEQGELAKLQCSASSTGEPMNVVLDRILLRHRLDYYARGGIVVIASRSWLWGPPAAPAADADMQARIAEALGQLESELVDRRTGAERAIIDAGPAAIPILEKEQGRSAGTKRERLHVLVDRILSRHVPDRLHPLEAEPGLISEDARDFLRTSKDRAINISFFKGAGLAEILARIAEFSETPIVIDPSVPADLSGRRLTLAVQGAPVLDLVEALVVPLGAAVRPEAGRLLIVPRR